MSLQAEHLASEIESRRTFAIISHPDAGKTTITEKLLLCGGAIRLAGSIKGRKTSKYAASDWMEMERQRGISITSSVLQFSYRGCRINILDTPGHQDFSEDTYRTLMAADSALMLIDMAKGVEPQTIKLFKVCRMQGIPIFTFINKLDRQGQEPLDLLDEIEKVLGIGSYPFNWPAGAGTGSYGIYDRRSRQFELHAGGGKSKVIDCGSQGVNHPHIKAALDARSYAKLGEEIELLDTAGEPYAPEKVARGLQTPVFFGSAINGFGVDSFFNTFLQLAPPPAPRKSSAGLIEPASDDFSGFVFKIQANMNPAHRDRIAFLRICSGTFKREMLVNHARTGKKIRLSQPQQFLAQNRNIVEEAYPGDIIGLYDPGIFKVGDTISTGKTFHFARMPRFSPEHFARVSTRDALKYKQFHKGLTELAEEGAVQVFTAAGSGQIILGAVGELQFEVFQYRMKNEYGVDLIMQRLPYTLLRRLKGPAGQGLPDRHGMIVTDRDGERFVLFENELWLRLTAERNPSLEFGPVEEHPEEEK